MSVSEKVNKCIQSSNKIYNLNTKRCVLSTTKKPKDIIIDYNYKVAGTKDQIEEYILVE